MWKDRKQTSRCLGSTFFASQFSENFHSFICKSNLFEPSEQKGKRANQQQRSFIQPAIHPAQPGENKLNMQNISKGTL